MGDPNSPPSPISLPSTILSGLQHRSRPPYIQLEGLGSPVSSAAGSGAKPQPKSNLVHFCFKIRMISGDNNFNDFPKTTSNGHKMMKNS